MGYPALVTRQTGRDKVIQYETLTYLNGTPMDLSYLQKVTYIADDYAHPWDYIQIRDTTPLPGGLPHPGLFSYAPDPSTGLNSVLVQVKDVSSDAEFLAKNLSSKDVTEPPEYVLKADFTDCSETLVPYRLGTSSQASLGGHSAIPVLTYCP